MLGRREFLGLCAASLAAQSPRPNVVLILADDLGYGELGCQGNAEVPTPHIDSIAQRGVRFTNGYVSAPYCCPSRAGLMTGRYQTRFGHERNSIGKQNLDPRIGLPFSEVTLADRMKAAGYRTALVGKWHLGGTPLFHPLKRGFDEFFGFTHEGHFFFPPPYRGAVTRLRVNEPPYDDDNPILRDTTVITEKEYLTDAFAREATAFVERNKARPFFLYLALNAIHSPMQAPVALLKKFEYIKDEQRRLFAAMTHAMDNAVGRVLEKLRDAALEDNTIVVFLSDNGGPTAELTSSNLPLRGGKGQLYEGGIRVPWIIQWKARVPGGRISDEPVTSLDLFPTLLDACGGTPGANKSDGVSLLPLLTGQQESLAERPLYWRFGPNLALRRGEWKLVRQAAPGQPAEFALYNLKEDLTESVDRSKDQPERFARLKEELDRLDKQMIPARW